MKTPDEIKKGLETCIGECTGNKPHCPYHKCGNGCMDSMNRDALAYIQQLETERHQLLTKCERLERERDAAVRAISVAQHYIKNLGAVQYGLQQLENWDYYIKKRGVCEENTKEET